MHQREHHPWYMGSFMDFGIGIREFAGDIKFMLFPGVSFPTLLCCFVCATLSCNLTYWEVAGHNGAHRMC